MLSEEKDLGPGHFPVMLLEEAPTTKLVWFYLRGLGVSSLSSRKLACELGLSQPSILKALNRLQAIDLAEKNFYTKP
jgi:Mn-dependent DtxR family transcriptional regulator